MGTKTEDYLRTLAEGGELPEAGCCMTNTQSLIYDAAVRVNNLDEEVQEIKNNPDVVDIVATYADLQAYDKSTLTDKDIVRVLSDSQHDGYSTYYRFDSDTNSFTHIGKVDAFVFEEFTFTLLDGTTVTKEFAVYDQGA